MFNILTLVPAKRSRIEKDAFSNFHKGELHLFIAKNVDEFFSTLENEKIDLTLISNYGFSDAEMIDMIQMMKMRYSEVGIMVLIRQDDKALAMRLYRMGIDEWIKRPFDAPEIGLRCRAVLRRIRLLTSSDLQIGNVSVDYVNFVVKIDDSVIHLPKKEFLLLHLLLSHPGKLYSRNELMEYIWGYDSDSGDATVAVHIGRIRKKFASTEAFRIVSVRGVGYKAEIEQ